MSVESTSADPASPPANDHNHAQVVSPNQIQTELGDDQSGANGQLTTENPAEATVDTNQYFKQGREWVQYIYDDYIAKPLWGSKNPADPTEWPPRFCKGYECPKFTVLNRTKDYEIRRYEATNWVSTGLTQSDMRSASNILFRRLFRYISGANDKKLKIPMTVPVIMRVVGGNEKSSYNSMNLTMSFYLTKSDNPLPTDPEVTLTHIPEGNMFVRSFPGYIMSTDRWMTELNNLIAAVGDESKYETGFFYTAGYDSPFVLFNRHNEVMLAGK